LDKSLVSGILGYAAFLATVVALLKGAGAVAPSAV
jgi:hypothetical protein